MVGKSCADRAINHILRVNTRSAYTQSLATTTSHWSRIVFMISYDCRKITHDGARSLRQVARLFSAFCRDSNIS